MIYIYLNDMSYLVGRVRGKVSSGLLRFLWSLSDTENPRKYSKISDGSLLRFRVRIGCLNIKEFMPQTLILTPFIFADRCKYYTFNISDYKFC